MKERQELHCHACNQYVQFDIDLELNGNHVLKCPNCDHEHCRVVKDGIITGDRWDQRNGDMVHYVSASTTTTTVYSTYACYSDVASCTSNRTSAFLYNSWMQVTAT